MSDTEDEKRNCPGSGREISGMLAKWRCLECGASFAQSEGVYGARNGVCLNMWLLPKHEVASGTGSYET